MTALPFTNLSTICQSICNTGGPQTSSSSYKPPQYRRVTLPHALFKQELNLWQSHLLQHTTLKTKAQLTMGVAIPSYRACPQLLEKLLTCTVTEPNVSLRFLLQIDQPTIPAVVGKWIRDKQIEMMHKLRVRLNASNLGAGMTRNALLDASAAQYVIFFDDDVEPSPQCIDAYVRAARSNPDAAGFAGWYQYNYVVAPCIWSVAQWSDLIRSNLIYIHLMQRQSCWACCNGTDKACQMSFYTPGSL